MVYVIKINIYMCFSLNFLFSGIRKNHGFTIHDFASPYILCTLPAFKKQLNIMQYGL